jgi:putative Mn2+ efflux pump MntP
MDLVSTIVIAVGLAMDAFSVCISSGMAICNPTPMQYFRLSFFFGLFQFLMPILGYFLGAYLEGIIKDYDRWVAFALLFIIGLKMIKESFEKNDESCMPGDPSKGFNLFMLSVATSIDALAVGLSIGVLNKPILLPSIIIGITCFIFSNIGIAIGCRVGKFAGKRAESAGGIMLIGIGTKILIEHLWV